MPIFGVTSGGKVKRSVQGTIKASPTFTGHPAKRLTGTTEVNFQIDVNNDGPTLIHNTSSTALTITNNFFQLGGTSSDSSYIVNETGLGGGAISMRGYTGTGATGQLYLGSVRLVAGGGTGLTPNSVIDKDAWDAVNSLKHAKSHAIDSASGHTSTITADNLLDADSNGLPADSGVSLDTVVQTTAALPSAKMVRSDAVSPFIETTDISIYNDDSVRFPSGASVFLQEGFVFEGTASGVSIVKIVDNFANALSFSGSASGKEYQRFITTTDSEAVLFSQEVQVGGNPITGVPTSTAAGEPIVHSGTITPVAIDAAITHTTSGGSDHADAILRNGNVDFTANQSMATYRITDAGDPVGDQDYITKAWGNAAYLGLAFDFYLSDTAEGVIADYNLMYPAETGEAQSTVSETISADNTLIQSYITESAEPSFTQLIGGVYVLHTHLSATTAGKKDATAYWTLSKYETDTTETLLITSEESAVLTNSSAAYNIHGSLAADQTLDITDRLVLKVYGNNDGAGADPVITIYMEGTHGCHLSVRTNTTVLDDRYVNVAGDTMTGDLTISKTAPQLGLTDEDGNYTRIKKVSGSGVTSLVGKCITKGADGDLVEDGCSDLTGWAETEGGGAVVEVDPAGQFHLYDPSDTNYALTSKDFGTFPEDITFGFRAIFDDLPNFIAGTNRISVFVDNGNYTLNPAFAKEGVYLYTGTYNLIANSTPGEWGWAEGAWHTWEYRFDGSAGTCDIWLDGVEKATGVDCSNASSKDGNIGFVALGTSTDITEFHIDWIKVATGFVTFVDIDTESVVVTQGDGENAEESSKITVGDTASQLVLPKLATAGVVTNTADGVLGTKAGSIFVPLFPMTATWTEATITHDAAWHVDGLDCTAVVPAGATAISFFISGLSTAANKNFAVRQNATYPYSTFSARTQVANIWLSNCIYTLPCDSNRLLDYYSNYTGTSGTTRRCFLVIVGYYI